MKPELSKAAQAEIAHITTMLNVGDPEAIKAALDAAYLAGMVDHSRIKDDQDGFHRKDIVSFTNGRGFTVKGEVSGYRDDGKVIVLRGNSTVDKDAADLKLLGRYYPA